MGKKENHAFLKTTIDALAHSFMVINTDNYHIEMANAAAGGDAVIGAACHAVSHHSDRPCGGAEHPCPLEKVIKEAKPVVVQHQHCNPDGSISFVEIHAHPVFDEQGNISSIIEHSTDVTERVEAERELVKSERRFHTLFETMPDAVFIADAASGMLVDVNIKAAQLSGYSPDELRKMHYSQLHPPESAVKAEEVFRDFERGVSGNILFRMKVRHADGHDIPVEISSGGSFDIDGRTCRVGVFRDITEREKMEEALRQSREQYMLAVRGSNDGIWDWDLRNNTLYLSPRWKEILGYRDEELPNCFATFEDNIHPEDRPKVMTAIDDYLKGNDVHYKQEFRMRHKDGSYKWILARGQAVRDEHGKPVRMAGFHTDMTEKIEAAEKLKRINADLERQKAVAQDLAVQAQAANKAKSLFLANMSHEVRTPMNGVLGWVQLLLDTSLDQEQLEYAQQLKQSGEYLVEIINDILDFSKIEAGKRHIAAEPFNLIETLDGTLAAAELAAREKGLQLIKNIDPALPRLLIGDSKRIGQVLMNLSNNAVKFTAEGEVTVSVRLLELTGGRALLRIEVTDTGIGVPEDKLKTLFDPFVQADSSSTRQFGGTGLGLAISKKLVEAMGGEIDVESREGRGSTFYFTLDLETAATDEDKVTR